MEIFFNINKLLTLKHVAVMALSDRDTTFFSSNFDICLPIKFPRSISNAHFKHCQGTGQSVPMRRRSKFLTLPYLRTKLPRRVDSNGTNSKL